jgi:hypothetical protein
MPLNTPKNKITASSSTIESIIKNIQDHQNLFEILKNNSTQPLHPKIEELEHQSEKLAYQLEEIKKAKQEEDILIPFEQAIQDLENRKTATHFSAFYNTFNPVYKATNKLSKLVKDTSDEYVLVNVQSQLDTRLKKMIKHDILCVLLKCVQQYKETQQTMEVETLFSLAQQDIATAEQAISKTEKNIDTKVEKGDSIWEKTLTECLSNLSDNKDTINIKDTIKIIQTELKQLSTKENIETIQGVLINIQHKVKDCFLKRRTKSLTTIEESFKELNGTMQSIHRNLNKETDQTLAAKSLNIQNSEERQKSDSYATQLKEALTLFFEEKEWDELGRGYLFFNKITPDGIVKIRNILKNDSIDFFTHEKNIFAICQIIKLKAHRSKSFSRRADVHTQYQELDHLLSKTYPHLYHLNCPPEESELNTHSYNEENTRELLEYLTKTIPGQSSLSLPSASGSP